MRAIAIEHAENHEAEGMNVLFATGHVEWFPGDAAARLLTDPDAFCEPTSTPR